VQPGLGQSSRVGEPRTLILGRFGWRKIIIGKGVKGLGVDDVNQASSSFGHRGVEQRPPQTPGRATWTHPSLSHLSNLPTREYLLLTRPNSGVFHIPHPTIILPRSLVCIHSTNHTTQKTQPFTQTISSQPLRPLSVKRERRRPHRLTTAQASGSARASPSTTRNSSRAPPSVATRKTSNNRLLATCVSRSRALHS